MILYHCCQRRIRYLGHSQDSCQHGLRCINVSRDSCQHGLLCINVSSDSCRYGLHCICLKWLVSARVTLYQRLTWLVSLLVTPSRSLVVTYVNTGYVVSTYHVTRIVTGNVSCCLSWSCITLTKILTWLMSLPLTRPSHIFTWHIVCSARRIDH